MRVSALTSTFGHDRYSSRVRYGFGRFRYGEAGVVVEVGGHPDSEGFYAALVRWDSGGVPTLLDRLKDSIIQAVGENTGT